MSFVQELDDVRPEIRKGGSGFAILYPKVDGLNVTVDAGFTATGYKPDGSSLGSLSVEDTAGLGEPSRLVATVNASSLDLGEGYRVEFSYTADSVDYVESVSFDVVLEPLGTVGLSLNDLVSEQADIGEMIGRQAILQADGRTAEQQAQVLIHLATRDIKARLRKRIEDSGNSFLTYLANKEDLRSVVAAQAIHRSYVAQGLTSETIVALATFWREEADRRFAGMPALKFSTGDSKVPDSTVSSFTAIRLRRPAWGSL